MKYIILLLCLCACKQNHEAKKADQQRRLESWTVKGTGIDSTPNKASQLRFLPKTTTIHLLPSVWGDTNSNVWCNDGEWLSEFSIYLNTKRVWSVSLYKDTATIMPTGADSLFKKAKVIIVAGKTFKYLD